MRYLKSYKLFESISKDDINDIFLGLEDDGFIIDFGNISIDRNTPLRYIIDISLPRGSGKREIPGAPKPPGGLYPEGVFLWMEVKDYIIRLNDYYYNYSSNNYSPGINYDIVSKLSKIGINYKSSSPFRMYNGGVEFGIGWCKPEDFDKLGDYISFTSLRIEMKL